MERFTGQVVVVTGGANGIGRACCERFGSEGASVVVADRNAAAGAETVGLVEGLGSRAIFVEVDATSRVDNDAMAAAAVKEFGRLDHVVTAAGILHAGYGDADAELKWMTDRLAAVDHPHLEVLDYDVEEFRTVLEVNLIGTFLAVQACAARMVELDAPGSVVTIASIASKNPAAGPLAYTASKSGVWMLTKKLATMFAGVDIRVNAVGPGFIETNMTKVFDFVPEERHEQMLASVPMGHRGQPSDIAAAAAFLCSEDARYFTGEILHPDGGYFTG